MPTINQVFNVTDRDTGLVYAMSGLGIISVTANGTGSNITQVTNKNFVITKVVNESPATILTLSTNLFTTNSLAGPLLFLSADRVKDVLINGTGATILYDASQASLQQIVVTDSKATVLAAIAIIEDQGAFVDLVSNQSIGGTKTFSNPIVYSAATGITAFAGGGQAMATALTKEYSEITVAAAPAASVVLAAPVLGSHQVVKNSGANPIAVFGTAGVSIDGGAANASVTVDVGETRVFRGTSITTIISGEGDFVTIASSQTITGQKSFSTPIVYSITTGITATPGGTQMTSIQLTTEINEVTAVASPGDSVKLPAPIAGLKIVVKNTTTTDMGVFPTVGVSIDTLAANAVFTLPAGEEREFDCQSITQWQTDATVDIPGNQTITGQKTFTQPINYSGQTGIIAHAGGGQGMATPLTKEINIISTVASNGDSVILAAPTLGSRQVVANVTSNVLAVFPVVGGTINSLAANASYSVNPFATITFNGGSSTGVGSSDGDIVTVGTSSQSQTIGSSKSFTQPITYSTTFAATAHPGGGQGMATALTSEYNLVNVVASAFDSVILSTPTSGSHQVVKNGGASDLAVFPSVGAQIDALGANASIIIGVGGTRVFYGTSGTQYQSGEGNFVTTGSVQTITGQKTFSLPIVYSANTGVTAHAGGGQGMAVPIGVQYTNVTVVGSPSDSVILPTPSLGSSQTIINTGANILAVFPAVGGTIDSLGANVAFLIDPLEQVTFSGISGTAYRSSTGNMAVLSDPNTFASSQTFLSPNNYAANMGITAHPGGGQAMATILSNEINVVSVCATAGDSVRLSTPLGGNSTRVIVNNIGAKVCAVFPQSGANIDLLAANASVNVLPGQTVTFNSSGGTLWNSSIANFQTDRVTNVTSAAINATAIATEAQLMTGYITSTSAMATTITTPSATNLAIALGAVRGTVFEFHIDNTAGASTVTLALGAGITQLVIVPNGGAGALTVAASATLGVGGWRIVFTSTTTAVISRII